MANKKLTKRFKSSSKGKKKKQVKVKQSMAQKRLAARQKATRRY